jgi:glutaredoxin
MPVLMSEFIIYTGENCHDCDKVLGQLDELHIEVEVVNIDKGEKKPEVDLFVMPALLANNRDIKAYGVDIVKYLKRSLEAVK